MEWAKNVEVLIGAFFAVMALLGTGARLVWARIGKRVDTSVSGLTMGHQNIIERLDAVEVGQQRQDSELRRIETQLNAVESRMGQLASKDDLNKLAVILARVEATGGATSQMVDSMYRGLVDRAERGK